MTTPTPFIHDQRWSLLTETESPQKFLDSGRFRPGRPSAALAVGQETQETEDPWVPITDRNQVLTNSLTLAPTNAEAEERVDLSRLVITTDAGLGKSIGMEWLHAGLNQKGLCRHQRHEADLSLDDRKNTGWFAFTVPATLLRKESAQTINARLEEFMAEEMERRLKEAGQHVSASTLSSLVRRQRRAGRIILLIDGLDQLGDCETLAAITDSPMWEHCHMVIAGRPFALQRDWHALFSDARWRFVRVEELTLEQQRFYLGQDSAGKDKIDSIPETAKPIFSVPRVLSYIRELPNSQLKGLKTAADVYYLAILELIKRGMEKSEPARLMAAKDGKATEKVQDRAILQALELLSRIAFDMVSRKIRVPTEQAGETIWRRRPNFYRVARGEMPRFLKRLEEQWGDRDFGRDWRALSAMNSILGHAVFDADVEGLVEIEFRNRSLQEFLCAYYLAQVAPVPDSAESDEDMPLPTNLWDWIFTPFDAESEEYYHVWQYLTEMPEAAIFEDSWTESVGNLFHTARQTEDGAWMAKRSCEMIFRAWPRMESLHGQEHPRAGKILETWWSEFEQEILGDQRGPQQKQAAEELVASFVELPEDEEFDMGTTDDRQGKVAEGVEQFYKDMFRDFAAQQESNAEEFAQQKVESMNWGQGPGAKITSAQFQKFFAAILSQGEESGMETMRKDHGRMDEQHHQVPVRSFQLSNTPVVNGQYRLFDPSHGLAKPLDEEFAKYSETPEHPCIYLSFFDAWVFARWVRFEDAPSRLPWEHEWEYACKFGTDWALRYWWHDDLDTERINCHETEIGGASVPSAEHANPATKPLDASGKGLMDMLGNVQEWCQDIYRETHRQDLADDPGDTSWSRVLRGGSFGVTANLCRSARRNYWQPSVCSVSAGVRLARARKS